MICELFLEGSLMTTPIPVPFVLAHGALGYWDELIFVSVIVIFLTMMGVSWFRSRDMDFRDDELPASLARRHVADTSKTNDTNTQGEAPSDTKRDLASDTYFQLD
jgi:hypothetical protein